jgi:hypothetical protein
MKRGGPVWWAGAPVREVGEGLGWAGEGGEAVAAGPGRRDAAEVAAEDVEDGADGLECEDAVRGGDSGRFFALLSGVWRVKKAVTVEGKEANVGADAGLW